MKVLVPVACLLLLAFSVPPSEKEFMINLSMYCGKQFSGTVVFPEGDKNPFKGEPLKIIFESCSEKQVRIPFHVGTNTSRTWVLTLDEKGLLLKHDHRHADGTPDSITMYGGYAKPNATAFEQSFPADAYTASLIPAAATNEWTLALNKEKRMLSYILKRDGQLRFHADYDLSKPIE
jgi:hypothetical protein